MKIGIVTTNSYEALLINIENIENVKAFSVGSPLLGYSFNLIIMPQFDFDNNVYEFTIGLLDSWLESLLIKLLPGGKIIQVS